MTTRKSKVAAPRPLRWEHLVMETTYNVARDRLGAHGNSVVALLDLHGSEGWELVAVMPLDGGEGVGFVMRRQTAEPFDRPRANKVLIAAKHQGVAPTVRKRGTR